VIGSWHHNVVRLCIVALRVGVEVDRLFVGYSSVPRRTPPIASSDTFAVGCIVGPQNAKNVAVIRYGSICRGVGT